MAGAELPTGTVSFLFTDIEQSTRAVAELGNARYADLLEEHRAILREAFQAHGGIEVGTEGDAFFVAFASAADAVAAAIDGQRGLGARSPLRVRMGVHTGDVLVRHNDYVGHDVHVAKRVQDAAHGGQILISHTTADLVSSRAALRSLGSYRLKDVDVPTELFQVLADGIPAQTRTPRATPAVQHNLPAQRTTFVGREREVARLSELLNESRLVTITGVGGSGKTRLAVEVGGALLPRFRDGVYFVELAPVSDGELVPARVAATVGLRAEPGAGAPDTVVTTEVLLESLASLHALVILDNCEHLIDACAEFVDNALQRCERLSLLTTSREALDVEGEHVFPLRSLALPDDDGAGESVLLFLDRARAVRGSFGLTDDTEAAVAKICRRLDGMPLAIELAAAQIAHLSVQELAERLDDRFALLSGGRRRVQRQQTLAAAVDWSYDLLDESERDVLCRVAVFPASFDLAAAAAVVPQHVASLPRILKALVAKSLVDLEDGPVTRYRLLETIRAYAQEKLVGRGDAESARGLHSVWVLEWLLSHRPKYFVSGETEALRLIEHDCLAALGWSEREGRYDLIAEMLIRTANSWVVPVADASRWYDLVFAHVDELSPELHAALCVGRAWLGLEQAEPDISRTGGFARRAIELAFSEDVYRLPDAYGILSLARSFEGLITRTDVADEVRDLGERGLALCEAPVNQLSVVFAYGGALMNIGDLDRAVELLEGVCQLAEAAGSASITSSLAIIHHVRGDHTRALRFATLARDEVVQSTLPGWTIIFSLPLALCLATDRRDDDAWRSIATDLAAPGALSVPGARTAIVTVLGALAAMRWDWERAAVLLGAARAAFDRREMRGAPDLLIYARYIDEVRSNLDPGTARARRDEGRAMPLDEALRLGLEPSR